MGITARYEQWPHRLAHWLDVVQAGRSTPYQNRIRPVLPSQDPTDPLHQSPLGTYRVLTLPLKKYTEGDATMI